MRKIKTFLMACLVIFTSHSLYSQIQNVSENDLDFSLLKWHYVNYPKSSDVQWSVLNAPGEGDELYRAVFEFEGREIVACYDESGKRLTEHTQMKDEIPISLIYYLDDEYDKYKILSFVKQTNFISEDVWYSLEVKTKSEGERIIKLDKNLIPFKTELLTRFN